MIKKTNTVSPSEKTALLVQDVMLSYSAEPVVKDASFDVKKGEVFGLIGLNGAGKTTLIKSILNMRDQQSGAIQIFGLPTYDKQSRDSLAFLPERFEPPWFLSGAEFVRFTLKLYKRQFSQNRLYELSDKLALPREALRRRVQTYSKGMRQKLGLIATLMTDCSLLILDEPMSGLDPKARVLVKDVLAQQKKEKDSLTVFLSSHILSDMDEICDRVAVLDSAHIQFVGTPKKLKSNTKAKSLEKAFLNLIEKAHLSKERIEKECAA